MRRENVLSRLNVDYIGRYSGECRWNSPQNNKKQPTLGLVVRVAVYAIPSRRLALEGRYEISDVIRNKNSGNLPLVLNMKN